MSLSLANYVLRIANTEEDEQEYCEYCGDELNGRGELFTCSDCQEEQDIEEDED
jgi:tRNA(Ile2) C34 agmatinyltransferase TiaS